LNTIIITQFGLYWNNSKIDKNKKVVKEKVISDEKKRK
jgi:hypothetical protein